MNKGTKIWLVIGALLVILGLILFGAVMSVNNWDFNKLGTVEYETNTWKLDGEFHNISIDSDTADIQLLPSEDGVGRVVCHEPINDKHQVSVENGTLTIQLVPEKKWYDNIGIATFENTEITVYLPENIYTTLSIEESTGDICVENVSAETMELTVSTGDVNLVSVSCTNLISRGSTGDLSMKNVIATEKFSIERSTGDVSFEKCDASELHIETDTGHVKGSLLSEKIFFTQTDTGEVNVPKSMTGGKCEIETDTGDIKIMIEEDHSYRL